MSNRTNPKPKTLNTGWGPGRRLTLETGMGPMSNWPMPVLQPAGSRVGVLYLACTQGLTLAHFTAQLKHFPWDRGCV